MKMSDNTIIQSETETPETSTSGKNIILIILGAVLLYIIYNTFAKPTSQQQQTQPPPQPPPQPQYTHSGSASIRIDAYYNSSMQITTIHSGTASLNIAELFGQNL